MKELVDKYLTENYERILRQKSDPDFRWSSVSSLIGRGVDPEYTRGRWRKLFSKVHVGSPVSTTSPVSKYQYISGKQDNNSQEFTFTADNIPTNEEIIEHFKIDLTKFRINQIYHKTSFGGKYAITVSLLALTGNQTIDLDNNFINKLSTIDPIEGLDLIQNLYFDKPKACLFIPKQDSHWNKRDINGDNSIDYRFQSFTKCLLEQLEKVQKTNSLEEIVYIIGSDEFNSEWTGLTTKGTPQQNILSYQEAFEKISEFNIETIKLLRFYAPKVEVVLLNGNHDHNVSWHLSHLLTHVFSKSDSVIINNSLENTKLFSYKENLILLNHGDAIKPKDLAAKFPIIAKEVWSEHSNFYCITGDKHHEVSHDYHGVMWFQVPQLSNAKSNWDDKMGFITSKAELLTFLFEEDGLSNILRKQIR